SNGGNLGAGLRLGEAIRAHKLRTQVGRSVPMHLHADDPMWLQNTAPGHCWSSCAYAFLGGVNRFARSGELGFHQFRAASDTTAKAVDTNPLQTAQETMGMLVLYLREMAIDPALLSLATMADPASLYRPDAEAMFKLNVIHMSDKRLFGGWSIEPYRSGAVVTGKLSAVAEQGDGIVAAETIPEQQVSFFCRAQAPGKVFLLGSWPLGGISDQQVRS